MAENLNERICKSNSVPSNEEIIEEVIKEVDSSLLIQPQTSGSDKERRESDSLQNNEAKPTEEKDFVPSDFEEGDNLECGGEKNLEDDFIDESGLKEVEDKYTDEEKEKRRVEAEKYKMEGNDLFKVGQYRESAKSYTLALRTCPLMFSKDRSIMYSNRAAAKMKLELKSTAIDDCSKAIELDATYLKARHRRAQIYENTEKLDEALADYQEILKLDPLNREALYATKRLPEQINERNEKLKADMLAKLKDLGNMILRPFNLSTDNFQVNQDPNSGGYSINFKSNSPR